MEIKKIVIIGAGKLAHQLVPALQLRNYNILQVYNRSKARLISLLKSTNIEYTTQLKEIKTNADLYIICIKDDAIPSIAKKLYNHLDQEALVVHTSGVKSITELAIFKNHGLFYPLHSFTKGDKQSFDHLPIVIHANSISNITKLEHFAQSISSKTFKVNDEQRLYLHLAAVIANNFTNHLLGNAFELLNNHNIDPQILHPIIKEATEKALSQNPYNIQTGPAIRDDESTINTHIELLAKNEKLQEIYKLMTLSIQEKSSNSELTSSM